MRTIIIISLIFLISCNVEHRGDQYYKVTNNSDFALIFEIRSFYLNDAPYQNENTTTVIVNTDETKYILKLTDKGGKFDGGDNFLARIDSLEVSINDSLKICKDIHVRSNWDYSFEETSRNGKNGNNIYHLTICNSDTCRIQ
jgi:hypothetical protein